MLHTVRVPARKGSLSHLEAMEDTGIKGVGRPRWRHLRWVDVSAGIRAGIGSIDRTHQSVPILVTASSGAQQQRALIAPVSTGSAPPRRAVGVGKTGRRVRAASVEVSSLSGGWLTPSGVAAQRMALVGGIAALEVVGQALEHGGNSTGGDVDGGACWGVQEIAGIVRVG